MNSPKRHLSMDSQTCPSTIADSCFFCSFLFFMLTSKSKIFSSKNCEEYFTVASKTMTYSEDHIRTKLSEALQPTHLEVVDESDGCGGKFSCLIVSEKFQGKPLLQRHKLVNSILQEELKTIHAFSQKTLTPDQWKAQQEETKN